MQDNPYHSTTSETAGVKKSNTLKLRPLPVRLALYGFFSGVLGLFFTGIILEIETGKMLDLGKYEGTIRNISALLGLLGLLLGGLLLVIACVLAIVMSVRAGSATEGENGRTEK